jgi:hypothetical protein
LSDQNRTSFDWTFWFLWIMATAWGWILGSFFAPGVSLVATGIATGVLQWLVLKQRIPRAYRWIPATAIGWIAGGAIGSFALPAELGFLSATLLGTATGLAQWVIIRQEVHWAGWWPLVSAVAWTTGLTMFPAPLLVGVMPGAMTGIALELLLRYARRNSSGLHSGASASRARQPD